MDAWYAQLANVKSYLISKDPKLKMLFESVDATGFQLHTVIKDPYTALIGVIIGQKISYTRAKALRGELYAHYGINLNPALLVNQDLSFLGVTPAEIITKVTNFILTHNIDLTTEAGIRSLIAVPGVGIWTIETTLLTCLKHWDIFPLGDKFLQTRMQRLYGAHCDIALITANWAPYRSVITWYLWRWF